MLVNSHAVACYNVSVMTVVCHLCHGAVNISYYIILCFVYSHMMFKNFMIVSMLQEKTGGMLLLFKHNFTFNYKMGMRYI